MRLRASITVGFLLLAAGVYLWSWQSVNAQKKRPRKATAAAPAAPKKDYSKFLHGSEKHAELKCDACHEVPTANWTTVGAIPDVTDYPGHAACVRCHRPEFFRGARPVMCTICHTKVSPRDDVRFEFAKRDSATQFETIFPHDRHQDVIATLRSGRGAESAHAVRGAQQTAAAKYNNCTICHDSEAKQIVAAPIEGFLPPVGTFKTAPAGHESCFSCHYQEQKPTRLECAGCHQLAPKAVVPVAVPPRLSLKFTHLREQHVAECTTCHINITREASLVGLKPDVPITSCSSCHKTSSDKTVATIETEFETRNRDAAFACVKCHTASIGSKPMPASHRALFAQ
jgi:hypothetical protein